ncbi:MAG: hypothetical protein ABSF00_12670 [Candidatus Bathyarchaeia archaeon]|jgi:hypothetical protein
MLSRDQNNYDCTPNSANDGNQKGYGVRDWGNVVLAGYFPGVSSANTLAQQSLVALGMMPEVVPG